jgi:hypothetical protein
MSSLVRRSGVVIVSAMLAIVGAALGTKYLATAVQVPAPTASSAADASAESCVVDGGSGALGGTRGILINGDCHTESTGSNAGPPTRTVFCGRPSSAANGLWNSKDCGAPQFCYDETADPTHQHPEDAFATFVLSGTTWVLQSVWCPTSSTAIPDTQALREQALRLLPPVAIGSAWTHRALINAQTILWAATAAERPLPTATVIGRRVTLRIGFDHADWDFGDTSTDTTTQPGRPYRPAEPCRSAQCPGYYGHTYTHTGPVTITLTVAWHAQFSLDNGTTWTDIDTTPLTGPQTSHQLDIVQARGVLVPDPDHP